MLTSARPGALVPAPPHLSHAQSSPTPQDTLVLNGPGPELAPHGGSSPAAAGSQGRVGSLKPQGKLSALPPCQNVSYLPIALGWESRGLGLSSTDFCLGHSNYVSPCLTSSSAPHCPQLTIPIAGPAFPGDLCSILCHALITPNCLWLLLAQSQFHTSTIYPACIPSPLPHWLIPTGA